MVDNEERHIGNMFRILSNLIRRKIGNELIQSGSELSGSQSRIISFLYRETQMRDVYQRDIEEEFDIRRSTVTSTLQLLEKNGYITRQSVDVDARLKKILLTDRGVRAYEVVRKSILVVEKELSNVYTKEEFNELFRLLDKLYAALEE